jgi:hypothetical protein
MVRFFSSNGAALSQEVPAVKWMSNQPALWKPYIYNTFTFAIIYRLYAHIASFILQELDTSVISHPVGLIHNFTSWLCSLENSIYRVKGLHHITGILEIQSTRDTEKQFALLERTQNFMASQCGYHL